MTTGRKRRVPMGLGLILFCSVTLDAQDKRPAGPSGTVTLPIADYDRLVDRAARPPKRAEAAPVPAVLSRAEAKLRVDKDTVRGTLELEGEVFRTGVVKVPLLAGETVLEARAAGRAITLFREGNVHTALLTGPSPFAVALEWGAAVLPEPGRASFLLPVPQAGSARATVVLPGEQADVQVQPGIVTRRVSARGETVVEATLVPGSQARFRWSSSRDSSSAASREARSLADVKTLVTLGEADVRLTVLVDVTVVQGEPDRFELKLPAGFEVAGVSGTSLESTREGPGTLTVLVRDPARRRHAFLVSLERDAPGLSYREALPLLSVTGAQRETGEVAIEGVGTLELQVTEGGTLRRMDVREVQASLRSLARESVLAAFRFHRRADEGPSLALEVKRFPDAPVLAAAAERAVATTLVTTEGRQLTEVVLTVRNHAQPFLKVALPAGATLLSAEVAGEGVKPVLGADGTRVPLLRPGFRPDGPYPVSFVYLHSGSALAKKGDATFSLPPMDVPVGVVEWELFLPDRYRVKDVAGNVLRAELLGSSFGVGDLVTRTGGVSGPSSDSVKLTRAPEPTDGSVHGKVTDESGAVLPGATVTGEAGGQVRSATSDANGTYTLGALPPGPARVTASLGGFKTVHRQVRIPPRGPARVDFRLGLATITEEITVTAETPEIENEKKKDEPAQEVPSFNVTNLQRRVAGVLPVRIDVPRSGVSYRFARALVLDEETTVGLRYRRR